MCPARPAGRLDIKGKRAGTWTRAPAKRWARPLFYAMPSPKGEISMLKLLERFLGNYQGEGINHEGQRFQARLSLESILGGKAISLRFTAEDPVAATPLHQEQSVIAPDASEQQVL